MTKASALRVAAMAAVITLKQLVRFKFYLVLAVAQPLLFMAIVGLLTDDAAYLERAAMGAGVMGMWSATLFGAGGALERERQQGTLEHVFIAPVPLVYPVLGICLGAALLGLLSLATATITAWLGFGVALPLHTLPVLLLASLVAVAGMAALGVLITTAFLLVRQARALTNLLEWPVWICCGLLLPAGALPGVLAALGAALTPTWVARLLEATVAEDWTGAVRAVVPLLTLAMVYVATGLLLLRRIGYAIRDRGDLTFI